MISNVLRLRTLWILSLFHPQEPSTQPSPGLSPDTLNLAPGEFLNTPNIWSTGSEGSVGAQSFLFWAAPRVAPPGGNWPPHRERGQQFILTWLSPPPTATICSLFHLCENGDPKKNGFSHLFLSENQRQRGSEPTSALCLMSGQNNPWLDRSAKELTKKKKVSWAWSSYSISF